MKCFSPFILLLFLALLPWQMGCESQEQNSVNKAQYCLDHSPADMAYTCKTFVEGLESPSSYAVRCSADFLSEGMTSSMMARAFINRDQEGTSGSPLLGMMGILSFRTMENAESAYANCLRSQLSSFVMFASMARMSTKITSVANITVSLDTKPTQEVMETAIQTLLDSTSDEDKEIIGQTAVTLNAQYCTEDNSETEVCQKVNDALTQGTTNLDIGNAILLILQTNT